MPRRGNVPKREILPDPIYGSVLVTKLVNSIMLDSKKGVAQKVVYGAFDIIKRRPTKTRWKFHPGYGEYHAQPGSHAARVSVLPIRSPWRFVLPAARPSVCAGDGLLPRPR